MESPADIASPQQSSLHRAVRRGVRSREEGIKTSPLRHIRRVFIDEPRCCRSSARCRKVSINSETKALPQT